MTPLPTADNLRQIISRLERLSIDSALAHRAAGLRGSLITALADIESGNQPPEWLSDLIEQSFAILVRAAQDIPGDDEKINLAGEG